MLTVAVGVPFFVLSTTSPLLQRWFAASGHPSARDPYFLYAASNAGSLLGLLGYPFFIEPELTLDQQQWVFMLGVMVYIALVVICAMTVIRARHIEPRARSEDANEANAELHLPHSPIPAKRIARWVFLAALPSSLLLGVTTHVSTDLAPVPLLWVVPLALYLLSFIIVFARWPDSMQHVVGRVTPVLILFVVLSLLMGAAEPFGLIGALHLGAFFGVCLMCHGELAKDRPPPEHLTAFYFWLSLGGVLGGLFNALVAPIVFHKLGMVEYPLALILAAMIRPRSDEPVNGPPLRTADVLLVLVLLGISVGLVLIVPQFVSVPAESDDPDALPARLLRGGLMFGLPSVAAFALVRRPARYALSLAALFVAGAFDPGQLGDTLHMERNFFGVVRVTKSPDGKFVRLIHGTTLHGQQRTDEPGGPEGPRPMTYYHAKGPVGRLFESMRAGTAEAGRRGGAGDRRGGVLREAGAGVDLLRDRPGRRANRQRPGVLPVPSRMPGARRGVRRGARRRAAADHPRAGRPVRSHHPRRLLFGRDPGAPAHAGGVQALLPEARAGRACWSSTSRTTTSICRRWSRASRPTWTRRLALRYSPDSPTEGEKADGKTASQWMVLARSESDLGKIATTPAHWEKVPVTPGPVWRDDFANLLKVWKKREE